MMNSPRKRPDFDSEDIYFLIRQGLLGIVLSTIAVLFGLMLLYAGFSSKRILNSLFGLVFTPIAVLQLWMCIKEILMYSTASI